MTEREQRFYEAQADRLVSRLSRLMYTSSHPLSVTGAVSAEPVPFERRSGLTYRPMAEGEVWGTNWKSAWFHLVGKVPADWRGACVVLHMDFGSEACLFDAGGRPAGGLSRASIFAPGFKRDIVDLTEHAAGGEAVDLWVEAAANDLFGLNLEAEPAREDPQRHGTFEARLGKTRLLVVDPAVRSLYRDCVVLLDLMRCLPERSVRRARILSAMTTAADAFRDGNGSLDAAGARIAEVMASPAEPSAPVARAVGHAHIDTGWLWPVRETIRKCARTFSSQVAMIRKYPGYVFGASSPQHYAFVKEHYPSLYQEIREAVAAGRWELQGAMWVEADCNVPSGESLVRQVLVGKNFFRDEFGVDVRNLWIPDVFGYSAALPQILKRAGVDYFLTQKISWNQFNRFPHHTFRWRGIDGSEVITHFPPEDTYNSELKPSSLRRAQENFEERGRLGEFAVLYGVGDGGGGPLEEHVEAGLRQRNLEGAPRVVFGKAQDFFDRLRPHAPDLPVWKGELYFELHRGTLTTQARNKRMNRVLEHELRAVEYLLACGAASAYPAREMDALWKRFLINQFHDIIPGSSIHQVYVDSLAEYAGIRDEVSRIVAQAAARVLSPEDDTLTLVNSLNEIYDDPVLLPASWKGHEVSDANGTPLPAQHEEGGTVVLPRIEEQGAITLKKGRKKAAPVPGGAEGDLTLENQLVRYAFDADGRLRSAYDKGARREILDRPGSGNALSLYNDSPANWDAWDVDIYYERQHLEDAAATRARRIADGPVRAGIRFDYRVGSSAITQEVYLPVGSPRLDFRTRVDWRERRKMLRVSFEVAVDADEASYEIQYGTIRRPTHRNTTWDMARFEVCGHRFADLSEEEYGVALLNDCKYGYKVLGRRLDLNLLRSTTNPDPDADQGEQVFTYSLLPHAGRLPDSDVYREAAKLNQGVLVLDGMVVPRNGLRPPCRVSGKGVILGALKKAEKEASWVVRVYEQRGRRSRARLTAPGHRIAECDIMEWNDVSTVPAPTGELAVDLAPFEIRTFKLTAAD